MTILESIACVIGKLKPHHIQILMVLLILSLLVLGAGAPAGGGAGTPGGG